MFKRFLLTALRNLYKYKDYRTVTSSVVIGTCTIAYQAIRAVVADAANSLHNRINPEYYAHFLIFNSIL